MFTATELGEKATRDEVTRVFDACSSCRDCAGLCTVFPSLFDLLDGGSGHAGDLTPAEQDRIVDACILCRRCVVDCSAARAAGGGEAVDLPRAVLRSTAMRLERRQVGASHRRWVRTLRRPRRLRRLLRVAGTSAPGTPRRRLLAMLTGLTAQRPVPTTAQTTPDTVDVAGGSHGERAARHVVLVPTCTVAATRPSLVAAATAVFARRGAACSIQDTGCCGAASLHAGDIDAFRRHAERNVARLADVPGNSDIVVLDATCAATMMHEYPRVVDGRAVDDVTGRIVDPAAALLALGPIVDAGGPTQIEPRGGAAVLVVSGHATWSGSARTEVQLLEAIGLEVDTVVAPSGVESPAALGAVRDDAVRTHRRRGDPASSSAVSSAARVVSSSTMATLGVPLGDEIVVRHTLELIDELDRRGARDAS